MRMGDGTIITAIGTAVVLILGAIVTAWINLRKSGVEADKIVREGVIGEWREISTSLALRLDELQAQCSKLRQDYETEIKTLRRECESENRALRAEMSQLRNQIVVRETEGIQQRGRIEKLTETVTQLDKPDPDKIAEAIAPKVVEALKEQKDA